MLKKIKEYIEYRKNKKIAKKAMVSIAATVLPTVRELSEKGTFIVKFVTRLANETKNIESDELVKTVLSEISDVLKTSESRLIEIFTYMAGLSGEEINKILVHSIVETKDEEI